MRERVCKLLLLQVVHACQDSNDVRLFSTCTICHVCVCVCARARAWLEFSTYITDRQKRTTSPRRRETMSRVSFALWPTLLCIRKISLRVLNTRPCSSSPATIVASRCDLMLADHGVGKSVRFIAKRHHARHAFRSRKLSTVPLQRPPKRSLSHLGIVTCRARPSPAHPSLACPQSGTVGREPLDRSFFCGKRKGWDGGGRAAAGRVPCCPHPPEPAPQCREPSAACGAQALACPGRTALTAARRARRWKKHYSNTWKRHYYHNFKTGKQLWEHPGKVGDSHAAQGGGAGSGAGDSASRKRALSDDGGGLAAGGGAEGAAKKAKPSTVDFSVVKEAGAAKILAGMPPIGKLEDSPELAVARHSEVPPNCHVSLHQSPMRSDNVPHTRTRTRTHARNRTHTSTFMLTHPSVHPPTSVPTHLRI